LVILKAMSTPAEIMSSRTEKGRKMAMTMPTAPQISVPC
jgi:hypothetical protein